MATKLKLDVSEAPQIPTLGAGGKKNVTNISVNNARTVTITIKGNTHASATQGLRLNVYHSPTGEREDWDTVPFAFFDLDLSAGNKTQETHNFDLPEHGFIRIEVENLDSAETATLITVWDSIRRWGLNG